MSDISGEILNNIWPGNITEIRNLMVNYVPFTDTKYNHTILAEIAHQAGHNINNKDYTNEQRERFEKQNELFKYLWCHPKMIGLRHNNDYRDKYGYTALERLRGSYKYYCQDMKNFVKENICKDIEKVEIIEMSLDYYRLYEFKNTEYFGKLLDKNDIIMAK